MKLFKITLSFLLINPLIGLADITWEVFAENITFIDADGRDISSDTVEAFVQKDKYAPQACKNFRAEITDHDKQNELLKKTLKCTVQENVEELLKTNNGRILLEKINDKLNEKNGKITESDANQELLKINFSWYANGVSIDKLNFFIDPFDLYSATDFYLIDGTIEKKARPDVYFFHELVHLYHFLTGEEKEETPSLPDGLDESEIKEHFPQEGEDGLLILDFEELKTITGLPISKEEKSDKSILCENSYRSERNFPQRLNLLDGNAKNLKNAIQEAANFYQR